MNWINPRDKLPDVGDKVWVLVKDSSYRAIIGETIVDQLGFKFVDSPFDMNYGEYHFFEFNYQDSFEWDFSYPRKFEEWHLIKAWIPFRESDIPDWQFITMEECFGIITQTDSYKKEIERRKSTMNKEALEKRMQEIMERRNNELD